MSGESAQVEGAPPHRLRSRKRRALVERQAQASLKHNDAPQPPQKRLRRTQAYSDLEGSSRPRNSPIIPISIHQDDWLEGAVIKARKIINDKENAENFLQRVTAAQSAESLINSLISKRLGVFNLPPRLALSHKNKAQDLRSRYSSPTTAAVGERTSLETLHRKEKTGNLRSKYSSPSSINGEVATPDLLPSVEGSRLSSPSSNDTEELVDSTTSPQSLGDKQQGYLYCTCQRSFDPTLGDMVACDICDGWFHLPCVGQGQHEAAYFEEKSFYCPRCEAFAYQEIVLAEEEVLVDL
ncbi:hypothetical protein DOTSEDRAFT_21871 [Dothistroma septosporum NZE10]|uniref:PHD-type domain-containing protein n=1 Tax=Dothistroma septosporum (strain NZE10 / CBS 128990) TaxID=675120 RepID=N1Q0M1_DOTSN|nr:hypothetical protein DOTSEDRAFT_21871 [Dothistroma septosporum NZE10]